MPEQFCNDNRSANSQNPGYLYVGDSVDVKNTISATDGHFDSKLQVGDSSNPAGYMVLNGTLDVMDSLIASDGNVSMKNLIVQDAAQINKSLKVLGDTEIVGSATINKVVIKEDSISTSGSILSFNQGKSGNGVFILMKSKSH